MHRQPRKAPIRYCYVSFPNEFHNIISQFSIHRGISYVFNLTGPFKPFTQPSFNGKFSHTTHYDNWNKEHGYKSDYSSVQRSEGSLVNEFIEVFSTKS